MKHILQLDVTDNRVADAMDKTLAEIMRDWKHNVRQAQSSNCEIKTEEESQAHTAAVQRPWQKPEQGHAMCQWQEAAEPRGRQCRIGMQEHRDVAP